MAEALMLRAPTSRLATQIRTHARVLASLKLRPAPGEYSCAAAVQPRPTQDRAERDVSLTSEERAKLDREQQQGDELAGAAPAAAPEETPLLSTGKTALRAATTTKPSTSQSRVPPRTTNTSEWEPSRVDHSHQDMPPAPPRRLRPGQASAAAALSYRPQGPRSRSRSPGRRGWDADVATTSDKSGLCERRTDLRA
ncbi:hypothetical protein C6P46_001751 [Rhodotorula mucilaginosa]|uniref:Uncharacterized protein n=1 Tax=Rhodotorula mucilaginosa TaxID=5537 RepID=A0A9P7B217_RHOMI|nr:hypothetical protein C6P46_001751 [Rhodotorula mucilaginosa]TKA52572.1 hypothetical protein B0A53_04582 [Rhodotorula sp. CCFEE 5036]